MKKTKKPNQQLLTLVLNGGNTEMDSATIPIKWFFSQKLIEKSPTHLVFCEQSRKEFESKSNNMDSGRRYLVKVEDAVHFLEIPSSGDHQLICPGLFKQKICC